MSTLMLVESRPPNLESSFDEVLVDQLKDIPLLLKELMADHPDTCHEVLNCLANDDSTDLKYAMAENHNLPNHILDLLTQDENPYIVHRALMTIERKGC